MKAKNECCIDLDLIEGQNNTDTSKVVLQYDDNDEPSAWLEIVGKDSNAYRLAMKRLRQSSIKRFSIRGAGKINAKTDEGAEKLDSIQQEHDFEIACAVTFSWHGFVTKGEPTLFTAEGLKGLLIKRPSYREKIIAQLEDEQSFLKK